MQAVNFFLVGVSFLGTAYTAALTHGYGGTAGVVCLVGCCTTLCFHEVDRRIRRLLKAGEKAMRPLERRLAAATGVSALRMVESVEKAERRTAYSAAIGLMHSVAVIAFFTAGMYAVWPW